MPCILQRQEKGCFSNLLVELTYTNATWHFLPHQRTHIPLHQEVSLKFQEALRMGKKAILAEFQDAPEDWRKVAEKFRNRWNVPPSCRGNRWEAYCH